MPRPNPYPPPKPAPPPETPITVMTASSSGSEPTSHHGGSDAAPGVFTPEVINGINALLQSFAVQGLASSSSSATRVRATGKWRLRDFSAPGLGATDGEDLQLPAHD